LDGGGEKAFFSEIEMTVLNKLRRVLAKISGRNYVEDFVRVYPNELMYNEKGESVSYTSEHHSNFLNHCKFYEFASQYLDKGKSVVLDAGCGSGYGTKILKEGGAAEVHAFDLSSHAIEFAHRNFSEFANFRTCGITDLGVYEGKEFDLVTCSEVLEHIKEYGRERDALIQLRNIMKLGGILVLGTPNDEMLPDHGFSYREIDSLFGSVFDNYLIIENALLPPLQRLHLWNKRLSTGDTGICVDQEINFEETVFDKAISSNECKDGIESGEVEVNGFKVNTTMLHNTHSWIVLAGHQKRK
jgi:2-polyprenyl-3-methyl-5-hydroxy-6-metoxy-1,4-benzoquinol methylase